MREKAAPISQYASKPALARAIDQARELGIDPVGFEVAPGGIIRVFGARAFPAAPRDEFEQLEQAGKL